jgi:hypothetical protein
VILGDGGVSAESAYKWDGAALCGYTVAGGFIYHSDSFFGVFILRWGIVFFCMLAGKDLD